MLFGIFNNYGHPHACMKAWSNARCVVKCAQWFAHSCGSRDRRVVRGNTYAAMVLPAAALQEERSFSPGSPGRAPRFSSQRRRGERLHSQASQEEEPPPVVECMLEEILDRPIEIDTISTVKVRDENRPPSPIFVPQPAGVDVATQVEDSDLFDFDVEVEPILQTLVGSTLEKSLAEVIEEMDLEEELERQEMFELVRMTERLESERVEQEDKRKQAERERRAAQNVMHEQQAAEQKLKSTASTFANLYVGDVVSDVFDKLEGSGFFFDPLVREIEEQFLPWLAEGVGASIMYAQQTQDMVSKVVADAVALQEKKREEAVGEYRALEAARIRAEEEAELARLKAEEEQRAEEQRLREEEEAAAAAAAAATEGEEGQGAAE
jgi:hypothetical protein